MYIDSLRNFRHACLEAKELVLERLETERSRFGFLCSALGVVGIAGFRLPSPLPLVLPPSLLALLQASVKTLAIKSTQHPHLHVWLKLQLRYEIHAFAAL